MICKEKGYDLAQLLVLSDNNLLGMGLGRKQVDRIKLDGTEFLHKDSPEQTLGEQIFK